MASGPALIRALLALCLLRSSAGQSDCAAVSCPPLTNCIAKEGAERGSCCPSCAQTGCVCEGYQYYDCIRAGFRDGRVPAGRYYLVDFGSTECRCPAGGGQIACRFIPCPDIPAHCLAVTEPADGCPRCERLGCVHDDREYEAGHSFQIGACRVCHCPTEGGRLTCFPVPDCDPRGGQKPLLEAPDGDPAAEIGGRRSSWPRGSLELFSKPDGDMLPLFKPDPLAQSEGAGRSHTPGPFPPTEPGRIPSTHTGSGRAEDKKRQELIDTLSSFERVRGRGERMTDPQRPHREDTVATVTTTTVKQEAAGERGGQAGRETESGRNDITPEPDARLPSGRRTGESALLFSPNQPVPAHGGAGETDLSPRREPPTAFTMDRDEEITVPSSKPSTNQALTKALLETCCEQGQKFADARGHCDKMEVVGEDRHAICRSAQTQCCLAALRESRCLAGVGAARDGQACGTADGERCGADAYQDCCSCCALGLRLRDNGYTCEPPRHMGYPCSHTLLTCCEGEGGRMDQNTPREKPSPDLAPLPERVSDNDFPTEAFSIADGDAEEENTAEGLEDVDECRLYGEGLLCQHRCINTPGSYRCDCHPGYILEADGHVCVPKDIYEQNKLREYDDMPDTEAPPTIAMAPVTPPSPAWPDPCEVNSPCVQLCATLAGQPRCSCYPGFLLMADGRSCKDTDECALQLHDCGPGFDCLNTEGSFRCDPRPRCPAGLTQDIQGNCVDTDECGTLPQPCSTTFTCINTVGSYSCQRKVLLCGHGYHASPDGERCVDVDECEGSLHRCGEGQTCLNLPGSYRCDCTSGYQYDSFRKVCVDVNECWRYPGRLCAQTCENTAGSYRCSCTAGFSLSADGKNCLDVDECTANPCGQECANVYGSYQCYCRQGYFLREDGRSCEDIDECTRTIGSLCSYKCVNVPGSYQCVCPEHGYTLSPNQRSCLDVDECAVGSHNCSLEETCVNIQGGFRCLSFSCPPNYRRVADTRCERISCPNLVACQNSPLRITYYQLSFQNNIVVPAQIFRIGPSPAYSGDNVILTVSGGNEEGYFSTRKLNVYTGAVYLHRQVHEPRDFLIDVEMKLWRQGTFTTFLAKIYVFITTAL